MDLEKIISTFEPYKPKPKNFRLLTGRRFTKLLVFSIHHRHQYGQVHWLALCDCGHWTTASSANLESGKTKSCGCLTGGPEVKHGDARVRKYTPEYKAFHKAKARCENPNDNRYHTYGGRGIQMKFQSYEVFLAEIGRRPSTEYSLNRKDNDGHYESGNVEWAKIVDQQRNTSTNRYIAFQGETKAVAEWAEIKGIDAKRIYDRLDSDWSVERALTTPVRKCKRHV